MSTGYYNKLAAGFVIAVAALLLAGAFLKRYSLGRLDAYHADRQGPKQYVCSMHPQVLRDSPGECPICGMFLIEKPDGDNSSFDSTLKDLVRPVNGSVLGAVTTVTPEKGARHVIIQAAGIINYDPRKVQTVSARFGGLIERSFVRYQFQHISKGQKIYEIYSPDIYTERWNYVKLVQAYPDRDDLTGEALSWFNVLGLSKGQVDSLKHSPKPNYHLAVYSQAEGYAVDREFDPETFFLKGAETVTGQENFIAGTGSIGLNAGAVVETGAPLFRLIDVHSLRIDLKVKTGEASMLKRGQNVIITDAADPGRQFHASVDQIEPLNGGIFQTVKVYLYDEERFLLPGRQIQAQIDAGVRDGLWVPATAVADLGQSSSVFVLDGNRYVATEVRTGIRSNGMIEILWGIDADARVAEQAFLLTDSDGLIDPDLTE